MSALIVISRNVQITVNLKDLPRPSLPASHSRRLSNMRCPHAEQDTVALSASNAFSMSDGLLRMAHCLIIELPEAELREIRCTLDVLLTKTDQMLDMLERDLSLNFDSLNIDPGESQAHFLDSSNGFQMFKIPSGAKILVQYWLQPRPPSCPIAVNRSSPPRLITVGTLLVEYPLPSRFQLSQRPPPRFVPQLRFQSELQPRPQFCLIPVSPSFSPLGKMSDSPIIHIILHSFARVRLASSLKVQF